MLKNVCWMPGVIFIGSSPQARPRTVRSDMHVSRTLCIRIAQSKTQLSSIGRCMIAINAAVETSTMLTRFIVVMQTFCLSSAETPQIVDVAHYLPLGAVATPANLHTRSRGQSITDWIAPLRSLWMHILLLILGKSICWDSLKAKQLNDLYCPKIAATFVSICSI